jgi:ribosomal protein S18 acetylase RimI-like enzyme
MARKKQFLGTLMLEIKPVSTLDRESITRIITGYVTTEQYKISYSESEMNTIFALELVKLDKPYVKHYDHVDEEEFAEYQEILQEGFSLGAYVDNLLIGIALVTVQSWNNALRVQEFHVVDGQRGKGIGRLMMNAVFEKGRAANFRIVICETQHTNVPAIRFYRRMGFKLEGIDLSLYNNDDYPNGEVAVFMKYKLI